MKNIINLLGVLCILLSIFGPATTLAQNDEGFRPAEEAKGLMVGESVRDFSATDINKNTFQLSEAIEKGPVVVVFYRGQWCPVCNRHMADLQDSLELIQMKGAQVVAVSPEKPEYGAQMAEQSGADFSLLYDENYEIAKIFNVLFRPDSGTLNKYNTLLGAKLKKAHSDESQRLPVPATFIIDQNSEVVWRQFDPDYKVRASVKDILQNLPG